MKAELLGLFRKKTTEARSRARTELDAWLASITIANEGALQAECAVTLPSNVDSEKALKLKVDARKADYVLLLPIIRVATSARRTVLASALQALSKNAETKTNDVVMLEREWRYWEACYTREVRKIKEPQAGASIPSATQPPARIDVDKPFQRLLAFISGLFRDAWSNNAPRETETEQLAEARREFSNKIAPIQKKLEAAKSDQLRAIAALDWFKAHQGTHD